MNKINWKDLAAVTQYAKALRSQTDQLIFWNGKNYQITHASRRGTIEDQGYVVTRVIPGRNRP